MTHVVASVPHGHGEGRTRHDCPNLVQRVLECRLAGLLTGDALAERTT